MIEEDPLSIVQVRYARGEIETKEYEEFHSWFLKNVSFQQVPSFNIASERYANGEISIEQYKEIISRLLNDISNYQQSAPLRIVHQRYAEGLIETEEFEEKIRVLTRDIPAHSYSPPLSALFMRFAKGEIDNLRYQEMLNHLATYSSPTLPGVEGEVAALSPESEKNQAPAPKPEGTGTGQKPPTSSPSFSSAPPKSAQAPNPYRLNYASSQTSQVPSQTSEAQEIQIGIQDGIGGMTEVGRPDSAPMAINEQEIIAEPAPDITAEKGSYHITDISASFTPVTVLVKPEADIEKKETTISFKQNIAEVQPEEETKKETELEKDSSTKAPEPENVITEVATSPSGNHQKIKALIKQGKYFESITRLDEMLIQSPDDYRSLFLKSIALFNIGKGEEALEILSKAKETCTNKDDAKEIERIYSHIAQKGGSKNEQKKEKDTVKTPQKDLAKVPSLTIHPEREKNKRSEMIEKICEQAQSFIDAGDYKGANDVLADVENLVKDIPVETMEKECIDDLFAAKGFALYQMKDFCEAKKFFKEATKINPKNETAIHYLNDIRVRDCNKFVRHV